MTLLLLREKAKPLSSFLASVTLSLGFHLCGLMKPSFPLEIMLKIIYIITIVACMVGKYKACKVQTKLGSKIVYCHINMIQ
jgi:hypothetical protein